MDYQRDLAESFSCPYVALPSPCRGKKKKAPEGDSEQDLTVPALNHPQKSLSLAINFKGNLP